MKRWHLLSLAFVVVSGVALASDPPMAAAGKEKPEWMKYTTPGEGHKHMADLAGKWNYTLRYWMSPEAKPEEVKGKSTSKLVLGGRFLQQDARGKMMGQNYEGMGFSGYDSFKGEWQSVWFDNMSTAMMWSAGAGEPTAKSIQQSGTFADAMTGDKNKWFRTELKIASKDAYTYEMYTKTADGKETKAMEIEYKRAK